MQNQTNAVDFLFNILRKLFNKNDNDTLFNPINYKNLCIQFINQLKKEIKEEIKQEVLNELKNRK